MIMIEVIKCLVKGLDVVIVGVLNIVGCLMLLELLFVGCMVIICYKFIQDLKLYVSCVDLLVVVVGKFVFILGDWIKFGVIVIDVGINCIVEGGLVGDVEFDKVKDRVGYIIFVLGGVGLMIVVSLIENMLEVYVKFYL